MMSVSLGAKRVEGQPDYTADIVQCGTANWITIRTNDGDAMTLFFKPSQCRQMQAVADAFNAVFAVKQEPPTISKDFECGNSQEMA